jgi:hypothetical protein
MPQLVVHGATLRCSFGAAPSALAVTPANATQCGGPGFAATMPDHIPNTNIMSFGMCTSLSNPQVASATAAALGVLTPQPCVPATLLPWVAGSPTVLIGNQPALNNTSTCPCNWLGVVTIASPGQTTTEIP